MKIFCLSIYNNNYEKFKKLNLIPVGLGDENFDSHLLNDKCAKNISNKNKNFGEYTFHYHLWKNILVNNDYNDWIGFCSYRRFWTNGSIDNVQSFEDLDNILINKISSDWEKFDALLNPIFLFEK